MKKTHRIDKNCGELRVRCGELKPNYPQGNSLRNIEIQHLRVVAGNSLYYVYAHARAHTHAYRGVGINYPQLPATAFNHLNDKGLGCGEWVFQLPADYPQCAGNYPQSGRWAS